MSRNDAFLVITLLVCLGCFFKAHADHDHAPGFGVDHYKISLNFDFKEKKVAGSTRVAITAQRQGLDTVRLQLLNYQVDSVTAHNQPLSYAYNDTLLHIKMPNSLSKGDSMAITVHYQGEPPIDASGWGGFYFRKGVAFNLGVGFSAKPHNFGRAWFPCLDNFTDRATYAFYIETPEDKKAYCNGLFQGVQSVGQNRKRWHWELKDPIPSYLASVAAGPYTTVKETYEGIKDTFPVLYAVQPEDSADLKEGFATMPEALEVFEHFYGPQPFNRVGYTVVPFSSGAMEHATNIAYPDNMLKSPGFAAERLWAHELSHHWWGDLTTTHRAEEMWLNEGWATFSEFLFLDHTYGDTVYQQAVRDNHYRVLTTAHVRDGRFRPLVPLPHSVTYGTHAYNKGADVINTLRHHLGDSLFRKGLRYFLEQRAFQPMTSKGFRDTLEAVTGKPLEAFFKQWVFNPGFPHFSLKEMDVEKTSGTYQLSGTVVQQLHEAPDLYQKVKLPITAYFEGSRSPESRVVTTGGKETDFEVSLPAKPDHIVVDPHGRVADAKIIRERNITQTGNYPLMLEPVSLTVEQLSVPAFSMMVEQHWVGPSAKQTNEYILSRERYWRFEGNDRSKGELKATFLYDTTGDPDGLAPADPADLVLLHKPHQSNEWTVYNDYKVTFLGRQGRFEARNLAPGEYCIAKPRANTGQRARPSLQSSSGEDGIALYPQPADDQVKIELADKNAGMETIQVYSMNGQLLIKRQLATNPKAYQLSTAGLSSGSYVVQVTTGSTQNLVQKLLLQ